MRPYTRDAMCRYMYIYFSNCSHQTFILLDCCSAADVRTLVDESAPARKVPKVYSGWAQEQSHLASSLIPSNGFHRTIDSSRVTPAECIRSIGLWDIEKSVGIDNHVSYLPECPTSLCESEGSPNVAFIHPVGIAPLSDATHIRQRCRSGASQTAAPYLPLHPENLEEKDAKQELGSSELQTQRPRRQVRSASSSAVESSVNSTFESPAFVSGKDGTEDMASRLQHHAMDTGETRHSQRKMSWAAQVEEELHTVVMPEQSPLSSGAYGLGRPEVRELLRGEASRSSGRSVSEARTGGTWKSNSAVHEGRDQWVTLSSPLLRSSSQVRSNSEEGLSETQPGVFKMEHDWRAKEERSASSQDEPSSSAMQEAVILRSDPAVLSDDKDTRSSFTPKQSQQSHGATRIVGVQPQEGLLRLEGFTPSDLLFEGKDEVSVPRISETTDDELQDSLGDESVLEAQGVEHQTQPHSPIIDGGPTEMTWAQIVRAGGSKDIVPKKSTHQLSSQDLRNQIPAYSSSPPRSSYPREHSKKSSIASVSAPLHVLSPTISNAALARVPAKCVQPSQSGQLSTSQGKIELPRGGHQPSLKSSGSQGQRRVANENIPHARGIMRSSDKTAHINPKCEDSDEGLRKTSQPVAQVSSEGVNTEEGNGSEWHTVVRKNRVSEVAKPTKATKSARRKAKSLKRQAESASAASTPVQNAALFGPSPKASPSLPPHISFSLSSGSRSTLLRPSYAAVASLRSPVMSVASSTNSSADTQWFSAPQSPAQPKPVSDLVLGSPESSDHYFSAPEELEEVSHRSTLAHAPEGHSSSSEAPVAIELTGTTTASTQSAQASREVDNKGAQGAEDIWAGSPSLMTDDTILGWPDQGQFVIQDHHSRGKQSRPQEVHSPTPESTPAVLEGSSDPPEPKASPSKTSKRRCNGKGANLDSKPDVSSRKTATPSSPRSADGEQDSPPSVLTLSPNDFASPNRPERRPSPTPSHNSTQDFSSEPRRRGRAGDRITHEVATSIDLSRDGSILRGEAPEFMPHTTPSKSRTYRLQSPTSLSSHMPDGLVQPCDLNFPTFAPEDLSLPLQSISTVNVNPEKSILMPWMSIDFWLPRGSGPTGNQTQCLLDRKNPPFQPREQTPRPSDLLGHIGQIRRLKPCDFIQVEQAVEQIGTWCPSCDPDY